MDNVSFFTQVLFILTTIITIVVFWLATRKNNKVLYFLFGWMAIQAVIGLTGFYSNFEAIPPRFIFLLGPGFLVTAVLFFTKRGRSFIESLDIKWLTLLHTVRVPVEIVLYFLFVATLVPIDMTYEGKNLDIISGITAPLIYVIVFRNNTMKRKLLLLWNFISLGLLINILIIAILSARTPFQQIAFEQPNIGVTYFPFVWLPSVIVPLVLIALLASIKQLIKKNNKP